MSIAAECPGCGAPIAFHVSSSLVTICEHCSTAVARTDRALRDLGKTADLHQTRSPLRLWESGSYHGVGFQITGHVQLLHGAGGVWDEWYLACDDGHWGWLAEAQGRFYLSFRDHDATIPGNQSLVAGSRVELGNPPVSLVVAEAGEARLLGARGEIPYYFRPGHRYHYVDLSGAAGEFGTIDFGDETPAVYLGREVTLAELGMAHVPAPGTADVPGMEPAFHGHAGVRVTAVTCQECGGALDLQAPDRTERVGCPYCGALHDCQSGVLQLLQAANGSSVEPALPLGAQGRFEDETFTLIGFLRRSTGSVDQYKWDEYLLYNPRLGFRWLVYNDAHWTYTRPVPPGAVDALSPASAVHYPGETAIYEGKKYKLFQTGKARVEYVAGELYWKVEAGETTSTADYVAAPEMLSGEVSDSEIHWSLGTYMTRAEVDACFPDAEPSDLKPFDIAPNQPYRHKVVYPIWAGLLAMALAGIILASMASKRRLVFSQQFDLEPVPARTEPKVIFTEPFTLDGGQNLRLRARGQVNNSWMYVQGDLFDEASGLVVPFDLPLEFYYGNDGGYWSEGSPRTTKFLSAVPAGTYVLRLSIERSDFTQPNHLAIDITQDILRARAWLFLLLGISIIPLGVAFHHFTFERRRWHDSDYAHGPIHAEVS